MSRQPWLLTSLRLYPQWTGDKSRDSGAKKPGLMSQLRHGPRDTGQENLSVTLLFSRTGTVKTCVNPKAAVRIKINACKALGTVLYVFSLSAEWQEHPHRDSALL